MIEKSLKRVFIETFESAMISRRFLRKDKVFHRIVNGKIVQLLSYFKFSGSEFTIQFSIWPLCADGEYSTDMDDLRVCEEFEDIDSWECDYQTDGCVESMLDALEATKKRLFPLFDLTIDYKSYLENRNNLRFPLHIVSDSVYMSNMALGNYELCKKSRETFINNRIEANQRRWGTNSHIVPSTQEIFEQECDEYFITKKAMDNGDHEYIEQYIQEKKRKSLESYVKAYTTPNKYKKFLETGELPFEFVRIPSEE